MALPTYRLPTMLWVATLKKGVDIMSTLMQEEMGVCSSHLLIIKVGLGKFRVGKAIREEIPALLEKVYKAGRSNVVVLRLDDHKVWLCSKGLKKPKELKSHAWVSELVRQELASLNKPW